MWVSARNDIADNHREDARRKRDDAKVQTLQAQIDEMRHTSRELLSRQLRLEEQLKANEASLAQDRIELEQHIYDVGQSAQAKQLDESRLRQQLAELSARIEDATRPIRSLQAHVAELIETTRRNRDSSGIDTRKFEELGGLIDQVAARGERQSAVSQNLRDSIDAVRSELERLQRDLLRTDDGVRIVEQELRRRVAEIVQYVENLEARMVSELSGIGALQAQIESLASDLTLIDPQFEAIRQVQSAIQAQLTRFNEQAVERDELAAERVEEMRQQFDKQLRDLQELSEQRSERSVARDDQLEETDRDLAYRIKVIEIQLEEFHQADRRARREMWRIHEQRARLDLDQAQQALEMLIESRRDADRQDGGEGRGQR